MNKLILADLFLFIVTIGWGLTYLMTKTLVMEIPPFMILWVRFLFASIIFSVIFFKKIQLISTKLLHRSLFCGFILWLAFVTQIFGIQYSTPGKAGVITGLFIIFVPILYFLLEKKMLSISTLFATILSFFGLLLFSYHSTEKLALKKEDFILVSSAFFYALHIIYIDKTYEDFPNPNIYTFILIQMIVIIFLSFLPSIYLEKKPASISINSYIGLIYNILIGTILAYTAQTVVQKYSPPTHVSLIMSFESVFAYLFSWIFYGEEITWNNILGVLFILTGIFLTGILDVKVRHSNQ